MNKFQTALEHLIEEYLSDYSLEDLFDEFDLDIADVFALLLSQGFIDEDKVAEVFFQDITVEDE